MESKTLKAQKREPQGGKAAARLRARGLLPGVVYGHGQPPVHVSLDRHDVELALQHGAHLLDVDLDGAVTKLLIKEVQYDHLQIHAVHVDLARVDLDERVAVSVPVELRGTAAGIADGGQLSQYLMEIEVECRVTDIPEEIRANVAHLALNQNLHVSELELPEGVSAVTEATEIVCTVRPLAAVEEEPVEEAEAGAAEPEIIARGKEEEQQ